MHVHLDPLGGMAGDMFAAALLDARPGLGPELAAMIAGSGLVRYVEVSLEPASNRGLAGQRLVVRPRPAGHGHHRAFRDVRALLESLELEPAVIARAIAVFALLADAEARVHAVAADEVVFHEVGAWDSIADVTVAAWLIERLAGATWSCAPLPLGAGRVATAHGPLPVPAPATALLLEGLEVIDDGVAGERVTPTGAAIVRHLAPAARGPAGTMRVTGTGIGCGTRELGSISNVLRVLVLEPAAGEWAEEQVAVCQFELDDQTPEDVAVALDRLRALPAVIDVTQGAVQGKKGRLAAQVQLLARPEHAEAVIERCFVETTTLGVRWHLARRATLARCSAEHEVAGSTVGVKRARRPGGQVTGKAEIDDLARAGAGHAGREGLRREAERAADAMADEELTDGR